MMTLFRSVLTVVALAATATAQLSPVTVTFSPNPAPPNTTVTVTITNGSNALIQLSNPCGWFRVFAGSQSGPQIPRGVFCTQNIVPVTPGSSFSFPWDQIDTTTGAPVPNGRYWIEARAWDASFSAQTSTWACLSVQSATDPTLTQTGNARVGQPAIFDVSAPGFAGAPYAVWLAFSQDNPVAVPGLIDLCLSAPIFVAFDGGLDMSGNSGPLALAIPNTASIAFQGFHLQGLALGAAFPLITTNALSVVIAP